MRYVLYFNATCLVIGSVMTITLAVVCLLFALYSGAAPEIARGLGGLLRVTAGFTLLCVAAGLATWGVARRVRLWPGLQGLLLLSMPAAYALVSAGLLSR